MKVFCYEDQAEDPVTGVRFAAVLNNSEKLRDSTVRRYGEVLIPYEFEVFCLCGEKDLSEVEVPEFPQTYDCVKCKKWLFLQHGFVRAVKPNRICAFLFEYNNKENVETRKRLEEMKKK